MLFEWAPEVNAGDALVALGTMMLAGVTAYLAWKTGKDVDLTADSVKLTREGLDLTRESIEAADRPFVVPAPHQDRPEAIAFEDTVPRLFEMGVESEGPPPEWALAYRLWNVGTGPAIVEEVNLFAVDGSGYLVGGPQAERLVEQHKPGRDEARRLAENERPPGGSTGRFEITYRSPSGQRYRTTCQFKVSDDRMTLECSNYLRERVETPR